MPKEQGVVAIFEHPDDLIAAAKKVRHLGVEKFDAHTPFAIHGLDQAMGIKRSWIPWATLVLAIAGWCLGFLFQAWTSAVDWPINVAGKPFVSWPAFIPVTFESMILIAGVSTTIILFAACGLPKFSNPVLDVRLTDDRFGLFVDQTDPNFDSTQLNKIFKECHVEEVKKIN